ncbi:2-dehydropantoate 2-reductase [Xylocopilactobacillus apicola]|uniref:2-dehydropantoate 2-reductase n=1 Tax=Xylocopilactobacillus apicola TaxID=2932184 RepID=A0AAU9D4V4_9LACO|nr:2-dehydropantoate 2-reductase [Xylocopilactobacillus apicola]BDR58528.1 2-dehydropantoate 2-reductase [Xylocopilactobacillus apicola]BDR58549.1 2-dehydropantoate 2-reductase [Xylocopilactobacillus apicola]
MKITILGAGGMGSRFAIKLHKKGNDVKLIDGWQINVDTIKKNGIFANFNGEELFEYIPIISPEEIEKDEQQADLIIVFTKSYQLREMLQGVKQIIGPNTYVLCLLNGMGHEEVLKEFVPKQNILLGITMWTAIMEAPGRVKLFGTGDVEMQNLEPGSDHKKFAEEVVGVLSDAGLNARYSENVKYSIYRKAALNGTLNSLCTILECNIGQLGKTKEAETLLKEIIAEFAAVGAKEGINLDQEEVYEHIYQTFLGDITEHYPSMYQDLIKNHRPTEIDFINGAISSKGTKYGVPTPYCTLLTQLIHAKEQIINVS